MTIEAQGASAFTLLDSANAANTAGATGTAVDISAYEGHLVIVQQIGVVTAGTIAGKIQTGDASDGSDAADVTGATFTSVGTSTDLATAKISIECNKLKKYIRYVGTIGTGPAQVAVVGVGMLKYV